MPKPKRTAASAYTERYTRARELLEEIDRLVMTHSTEQAKTPTHWTHAGDMQQVEEYLAMARDFLAGVEV